MMSLASTTDRPILKVLLVDDDEDDFVVTRDLLAEIEGLRFELDWVSLYDQAREAIQRQRHDVYLVDNRLVGGAGLDLLREAIRSGSNAPIIILTGLGDHEVDVEAMRSGAADFLVKGQFTAIVLERSIRYAIKHAEVVETLRQSEERYRILIETSPDSIAYLNLDGQILFCNHKAALMQGYASAEEMMGLNVFDCLVPEDRDRGRAQTRLLVETGSIKNVGFTLLRRDNSRLPIEISATLVVNSDGQPQALMEVMHDISERKEAEEAIQKLAAFPRLNPNPVLAFAADGSLTYFNQAAERMAYSLGKRRPEEILPANLKKLVQECLANPQHVVRQQTHSSQHTLSWTLVPIAADQTVHCYAEDISEHLNLEAQLRQSQKMESIGQLAAGVAHDFNNLLTIIQGQICFLMSEPGLNEKVLAALKQIGSASDRAANLTRQLLTFSRSQVMQPQTLDLNEVVNNVAKMLTRILGEDINLQLHYSPQLPAILADPGMMEQIIMNLAINARDAMPQGGQLILGTSSVNIDEAYVHRIPEARTGHHVCLRIADTGCGMAAATLGRIFEPFFTTKEAGKGTGLGLATVYGIVKQHQGWIEVESEIGKGSVFKVYLPVTLKTVVPIGLETAQSPVRGGTETILVAEDDLVLRQLVREILEHFGYRVLEAGSGVEALRIWQQHPDRVDLLLTDMVMPDGLSGRRLAEQLLAQRSSLKVIYTTGYSLDPNQLDFPLREGYNFLPKPFHPRLLALTVRACLDHRPPP